MKPRQLLSILFVSALLALFGASHVASGSGYVGGGGGGGGNPAMGGDIGGTASAATVNKVSGTSPIAITPANLQWATATLAPQVSQVAAVSGAGADMTLAPQAATTTGSSGNLAVNVSAPASGTTESGLVFKRAGSSLGYMGAANGLSTTFQITFGGGTGGSGTAFILENATSLFINTPGATTRFESSGVGFADFTAAGLLLKAPLEGFASGTPLSLASSAVTFGASGTTTLTGAQQQTPLIVLSTVTLTGAATLAFGNVTAGFYELDASGITLGGQTLTLTNGTGTIVISPALSANKTLFDVSCSTNHIAAG